MSGTPSLFQISRNLVHLITLTYVYLCDSDRNTY